MLAYGQHNLGLCGDQRPPNWAAGPVFGPFAQFLGLQPQGRGGGTNTQTNKHTFRKYILVWYKYNNNVFYFTRINLFPLMKKKLRRMMRLSRWFRFHELICSLTYLTLLISIIDTEIISKLLICPEKSSKYFSLAVARVIPKVWHWIPKVWQSDSKRVAIGYQKRGNWIPKVWHATLMKSDAMLLETDTMLFESDATLFGLDAMLLESDCHLFGIWCHAFGIPLATAKKLFFKTLLWINEEFGNNSFTVLLRISVSICEIKILRDFMCRVFLTNIDIQKKLMSSL